MWSVGALEVSTGKVSSIEAMNGSTVLLPCTYSSCIGIKNLYFNWHYDDNGTVIKVRKARRHKDRLCEHAVCLLVAVRRAVTEPSTLLFVPTVKHRKYLI